MVFSLVNTYVLFFISLHHHYVTVMYVYIGSSMPFPALHYTCSMIKTIVLSKAFTVQELDLLAIIYTGIIIIQEIFTASMRLPDEV